MIPRSEFIQPSSALLPSVEETLLLRAGLLGDPAAWQQWQAAQQTVFIGHNPAIQKLRLLLSQAHQRHHFEMDKASQTFLRLAYFKEGLRREIYQNIFRSVQNVLACSGISVTVLKGAALAETVYAPSMRHCHDIDLLINSADLNRATISLGDLKFHQAASDSASSVRLDHDTGLPLELHTQLFQGTADNIASDEMRQRARSQSIFGILAQILVPEDNLLHVCAHAFFSRRRSSLRWVSDAWRIIDKHSDLDWELLFETAARSQLTLPLAVLFKYLAEELGAAIPANVLARLVEASNCGAPNRQ